MKEYLDQLPKFVHKIRQIREIVIGNIVFLGEIPAPTFQERRRAERMVERLAKFEVDECGIDEFGNPVAVIHGSVPEMPPIFVVAHLDTFSDIDTELHYEVTEKIISGIGVSDNSAAVGVLVSLPEILRRLSLRFESSIVLVAPIHSLGRGNLRGIRNLLNNWPSPIRGAICLEGVELGRLAVRDVTLSGGELFVRPDLWELIDAVVDHRMVYSILTNGTLIAKKTLKSFENGGRRNRLTSIQVSIDGSCPEIHDKSRGKGSFKKALRGLRLLKEAGFPATVRVTVNRYNVDDLENIARLLLEEIGIQSFGTNDAMPMGAGCNNQASITLTPEQQLKAMKALAALEKQDSEERP